MSIMNPLIKNKNILGKFRESGKKSVDGYWEFHHLVGFIIFPSMNWDEGCMTIDKKSEASCVIVYGDHVPQVITLSYHELKLLGDYTDISNISNYDLLKINSKQKVSRYEIEDFIRGRIITYIESCKEDIDKFCTKWPIRDRFLKAIEEIENNMEQLYILKTDFYGE